MDFEAAGLFAAGEELRLVSVTASPLRADEVLVRIIAAGICHTDLTVQRGGYPSGLPIVLGHEGSGFVEEVGSQVTGLAAGDPVGLSFMSCGQCNCCAEGRPAYCSSFGALNLSGLRNDGSTSLSLGGAGIGGHFFGQSSFARYSVANVRNVVKVRPDAPLEMIGPFGCGIQTGAGAMFNVLRPEPGSSCIIFGAGGVGLSAVMAARVLECDPIIIVEPRPMRRRLAMEIGASLALDPADQGALPARLREATEGGAKVALDTTGMSSTVTMAIAALAQGGKLGLVGMHDMEAQAKFVIVELIGKGASVVGIVEGDSDPQRFIPYLVDLFMDGRFPVDRLMTFYTFEDINEAIAAQASGSVIKAVLRF